MSWMDNDGLRHLWSLITQKFYKKSEVDQLIQGVSGEVPLYDDFTGATSSAAGKHGLVPAPSAGNHEKYLKGDGTWGTPPDTQYTHPTYTPNSLGLYKVTVDGTGHVSAAAAVKKSDITSLGIPEQDTTYSPATQSTAGLLSSTDKTKIDNMDNTYAKKSDISGIYKYKGSVASASVLPSTGQSVGDVYNIETASQYGAAGANVAWNGTTWDTLGEVFAVTAMTNEEIDEICI